MHLFQACGDSKSRPKYFSEKNFEPLTSRIQKKFPNVDMSKDKVSLDVTSYRYVQYITYTRGNWGDIGL